MLDPSLSISSFGEDEAGEVYVCNLGGAVYRIDGVPNPIPALGSLQPSSVVAGDPDFTLTVSGTSFAPGALVQWNGADRPTTFNSPTSLSAQIPASDLTTPGIASVTASNPIPGGGVSGSLSFYVNMTFLDVPVNHFAANQIEAVFDAGVTVGCATRLFCPDRSTSRAEMAVFLLKASQGSGYTPPACTPPGVFTDVPCPGPYTNWIEDLKARNITAGCGDGSTYCPNASVLREEMAVFLLKTSQGSGYTPPACTPPGVFADVPCPSQYADWIEDLSTRGITGRLRPGPELLPHPPGQPSGNGRLPDPHVQSAPSVGPRSGSGPPPAGGPGIPPSRPPPAPTSLWAVPVLKASFQLTPILGGDVVSQFLAIVLFFLEVICVGDRRRVSLPSPLSSSARCSWAPRARRHRRQRRSQGRLR